MTQQGTTTELHAIRKAIVGCVIQRLDREAPTESLTALLQDPRRLAALGPTEEEVLADLTWPASRERSE